MGFPLKPIWVDDMYMLTMLQWSISATGDRMYLDRDAKEMVAYLDKLQQQMGFSFTRQIAVFWGRGDGWFAAGWRRFCAIFPTIIRSGRVFWMAIGR